MAARSFALSCIYASSDKRPSKTRPSSHQSVNVSKSRTLHRIAEKQHHDAFPCSVSRARRYASSCWDDPSVMVSSGEMTPMKCSTAASLDAMTSWTQLQEVQDAVTNRKSPEMIKAMARLDALSPANIVRTERNMASPAQASEFNDDVPAVPKNGPLGGNSARVTEQLELPHVGLRAAHDTNSGAPLFCRWEV